MAFAAVHVSVRAVEAEVGAFVVIERPDRKGGCGWIVTRCTAPATNLGIELCSVRIRVAVRALFGKIPKPAGTSVVTARAGEVRVCGGEGKGHVLFRGDVARNETRRLVAVEATGRPAELSLVWVTMTREAIG